MYGVRLAGGEMGEDSLDEVGGLDARDDAHVLWLRIGSAPSEGMEPARASVRRLRLLVEGNRSFEIGEATLTPSVEVGLRHEGGDAERGVGLELGAGIEYRHGRFALASRARGLVAHGDEGYDEWGASMTLRLEPASDGKGLDASIGPAWGTHASTTDALWRTPDDYGAQRGGTEANTALEMELGYGFANVLGTRGVWRPYVATTLSDDGSAKHRAGTGWRISEQAEVAIEASRTLTGRERDEAITLRALARW